MTLRLAILALSIFLFGCQGQQKAGETSAPKASPEAAPQIAAPTEVPATSTGLKTLGWSVDGQAEDGYKRFEGSGEITGTIKADWRPELSHVEEGEIQLTLRPDKRSQLAYPLLSEFIHVPSNDRILLALGLEKHSTEHEGICAYNVAGRFIVGDYHKGDVAETDAYPDLASLVAVADLETPSSVKCEPTP